MTEKMKLTPEAWADLQKRFPEPSYELAKVEGLKPGDVVFRNPTEQEYRAYLMQAYDSEAQMFAESNLMRSTVVFPEPPVFADWCKRFPGLVSNARLRKGLRSLSGAEDDAQGKG